jgi:hypothetical protein
MDYRFSSNYEDGIEHRIDAASDEEALQKAREVMADVRGKKPPGQQHDMRAILTKVIQVW